MARITLNGFYQYDKTLFDGIVLPEGLRKDILIADIMSTSGDLYTYHQVPDMLKHNITFWFSRRLFDFERMYKALRADYSPIENYDRIENVKRQHENSGQDKETLTLNSSTTSTHTGDDTAETQVSAYNETDYTNRDRETQNYNTTTQTQGSGSDSTTREYGLTQSETEETRIHGNIGVTTAQQMITEEMRLRATYDIYRIITSEFEREFLIQIY